MIDMFLKVDGIEGESTDKAHKGEIDVLAYSLGFSNSGTTHSVPAASAGKVNAQDLSVTVYYSKASPRLFTAVCSGKHIPTVTLTLRKQGTTPYEFLVIELTEVLVSSDSMGGSGGEDRLTENFSFNYAKINFVYSGLKPSGKPEKLGEASWNFAENVAG
jgi:type VI secretion system secreted protein Hcp